MKSHSRIGWRCFRIVRKPLLHPLLFCFSLFIALFSVTASAYALDVTLAWDANTEPDLAGYKLYYKTDAAGPPYTGTGATEGDSPIDVFDVTQYTIHGLANGVTYYFVVTAYDSEITKAAIPTRYQPLKQQPFRSPPHRTGFLLMPAITPLTP